MLHALKKTMRKKIEIEYVYRNAHNFLNIGLILTNFILPNRGESGDFRYIHHSSLLLVFNEKLRPKVRWRNYVKMTFLWRHSVKNNVMVCCLLYHTWKLSANQRPVLPWYVRWHSTVGSLTSKLSMTITSLIMVLGP